MSNARLTAQSQPVSTGGRSSKSGAPWPGHVLAALDEELGRVGREPHLDPLPVRLLDDLEDGPLVEVGLREDHLVGAHVARARAGARRATPSSRRPGRPVLGDRADELVGEPAAGCGERRPQVEQGFALADEHDPAADPCGAHHLERDGLVRRAQQADRQART